MVRRGLSIVLAAAVLLLLAAGSASAHGFSSVVYVDATSPETGHVRTELGLEYDLLVVSAADAEKDDPLFRTGNAAFEAGDTAGAGRRARCPRPVGRRVRDPALRRHECGQGVHTGPGRRLQDRETRGCPV